MRSDIVPGAIFPDYELSDHTGKHRKLSELQGPHPMVLVLSRGGYCPKDRRQHDGLAQLHRELEVGYCRLVTISTDNITETNEFRSGVGAHWPFLSDVRRTIQKDLDIAEYTDPVHNPMIPYTIVLEPGLVIYKVYNGYWFFGRPTIEDLRQDLRAVIRKCRPDWDITTPELRAAWQEGRKERFYPYGKTFAQTIGEQDYVGERPSLGIAEQVDPARPLSSAGKIGQEVEAGIDPKACLAARGQAGDGRRRKSGC
jgi:peroxiredoxin